MRTLFIIALLSGLALSPAAQADVAPEPESTEPADEDTAEETEEKTGCSSVGQLELGVSLLPLFCLGWLAFARSREEA